MKIKSKHFYAALALVAMSFGMPSCDSDDDDNAKPATEVNGGEEGGSSGEEGGGSSEEGGSSSEKGYSSSEVGGAVPTDGEAVDLGLPYGLLWAPYNVGATKPGEAGAYLAWGETMAGKTKDGECYYYWDNYKWTTSSGSTFAKYTTDGKTTLDPEDDAASVNWGGKWQMPTIAQFDELFNNCSQEWKGANEYAEGSLAGCLLTGQNGNTLFLPAAGRCLNSDLDRMGSYGHYWSAELYSGGSSDARYLFFGSGFRHTRSHYERYYGLSVRPVISPAE